MAKNTKSLQIKSITESKDIEHLVKQFLSQTFKIVDFENQTIIDLVSNPLTKDTIICFASYGDHNEETAQFKTEDLFKPFMQSPSGFPLTSLQYFDASLYLPYTFLQTIQFDYQTGAQTNNELHHLPLPHFQREISATRAI